jgi:hypothetical protein
MEYTDFNLEGKEVLKNIRCDLIIRYKNKLMLFEYKYRHDRKNNQLKSARGCVIKRNMIKL